MITAMKMINLETFVLVIGLVSMVWRVVLKYDLIEKTLNKLNLNLELCVMCVTFWVTLGLYTMVDHEISLFYNILRSLSATPFVIELTRKEWT